MRHYYRNVREIHRAALQELETSESASSSLLRSFVDWRSRLSNSNFTVAKDRVLLRTPQQLDQDPTILLLLLQFLARHGVLLAADSERRIAAAMPQLRNWYQESRGVWPLLREALGQPYAAQALRSLHSAGALTAILPEWEEIDCLVVRDFYHRYTVDEHTLIAIENLLALRDTKDHARRRFANLLSELESPSLLVFALLFHDTGKADGLKGHAQESAEIAGRAATRLGMSASDRETAMFLVEQHLALSGVINSRDLEDPVTARDIAARVRTLEWLKQLTLLTYADISAVNPTAMTPWRLEQLWRVYLLGFRELTRELETDRIHGYQAAEDQSGFLEGLPVRYLRTHTAEDIAVHSEMSRRAKVAGVSINLHRVEGAWSLTLVTGDRPFLFASIAGALSSFGMNLLKAEAFANARGEVVDGFVFADPDRTLELNPQEVDRLRVALERVILGRIDVRELLSRRPQAVPPTRRSRIKPSVTFDSHTSSTATLVEVVAEDRPGLLYDLSSALSSAGCNIEVVLIDTEAHRALDVFYVTAEGVKLTSELCETLREQIAAACQA
jgi:[protein-PII] uridylyltransferase